MLIYNQNQSDIERQTGGVLVRHCHLQYIKLKGRVAQKGKCCHHLLTLNCSKPVWIYFFCWTQKKIFWRM